MSFKWLKTYMPRGLFGRAALILVLPVVVVQLVVSVAFIQQHLEDVTTQMTLNTVREIDVLLTEIAAEPDTDTTRSDLMGLLTGFQMTLEFIPADALPGADAVGFFDYSGRVVRDTLHGRLPEIVAVDLPDNRIVHVFLNTDEGPAHISFNRRRVTAAAPHQLIVTMVFFGLLMTLISFLYLRNQLRPITRLASAAQAFGRGRVVPYAPSGAVEVRAAGSAFLDMRARIERQIEQRTMMLSGVSHDLRTPLTRMKLGLSLIDSEDAEPLMRDVDDMQRLVDAFLEFSRGAGEGEPEPCDPIALVRQAVEDAVRAGSYVSLVETTGRGRVALRQVALRRAIDNLLGNASRYGTRAEVSVVLTEKSLRIRVEDDGPGIPADRRGEAMKPFSRLDPSRNQNAGGGVGLGLAIVNDVARAHGGVLRLGQSARLGGLRADIVIGR
ncbi:MAG: ATP-binding protein [Pseudomonadota bacterium]|nr:ATP-binding protein [Pseudomonadota bacterium]